MKAAKNIGGAGFAQRKSFYVLLAVVAATQLSACSKTVQWEEEVPLNTGETIWVKRTDSYVIGGEPGNPLKMTWGIEKRAYEFSWQGQHYSYLTKSIGAILLSELIDGKDMVIVDATSNCAKPGYGEFRWRNGRWQLQPNISPELIGQPRNLMHHYSSEEGEIPARVTKETRNKEDTAPNRGEKSLNVDVSKIAINCSGGK